ncbi:MAG: hypothetical protein HKN47_19675, partial [Pirellulaceae bacterium]|nr:hypothetical protein [Pirellulaceae bacterium]
TTWDLPRILAEIDKQFELALAESETLQDIPVADYDLLLDKGTAPDSYRPTLYDVIAHNALEFYSAAEQGGARSQVAFDLMASSPIFGPRNDFLAWEPETTDAESPKLKAVRLYQQLIQFHLEDDDPVALLDVDLARLVFGSNLAFGEEKTARYKAALRRFADDYADHEISARAWHHLAQVHHEDEEYVKAKEIAELGLARFPQSIGANRCYNLIQQIQAREGKVATERIWNRPLPTIDITYRNITQFHFRLVRFDFDGFIRSTRWSAEQLDTNERNNILNRASVKSWSVDLPATEDHKQRVESFPIPEGLQTGAYYLVASHDPDFKPDDNVISFTQIWVSDLALVTRNHQGEGMIEGFVLNAITGDPITGATIRGWSRSNRNQRDEIKSVQTDQNGLFRLHTGGRGQLLIHAKHGQQEVATGNYLHSYVSNPSPATEQTRFFTDRAIYRPGQTIHYKGICYTVDQKRDHYQTIAKRNVTVIFMDMNNKEIERVQHRTNDYGSFSGSVTAPRDRVLGQMSLQILDGPRGQGRFRVEEYKRPKFQVSIDPPAEPAKLNGVVKLQGKATAYTGAAINDAKVSWRVVREVSYPAWWYRRTWWMPPQPSASQEIDHGIVTTQSNGTFDIQFDAKPDLSVPESSEPTFRFTVYADVTDTTGETRSQQRVVVVGYTALAATLNTPHWLTDDEPVKVNIRTTTLDGDAQAAAGQLKIHRLKQPETVHRAPLNRRYYGHRGYNNPPEPDPSNPDSWELGQVVLEKDVQTDANGSESVDAELDAGMYRAIIEAKDRFGKTVTSDVQFQVIDPDAKQLTIKIPDLFAVKTTSLEPNEEFLAIWGSGYERARAYIEVVHRGKVQQAFWTDPNVTQVAIKQKVTEAMRGGFNVRTTMVRENRAYLNSRYIAVPWSNKELKVKWERFVSKLEPAAKEKWTAIISGPDAERTAAEMVATLYDASLDAFKPAYWQSGFGVFRTDYSRLHSQFENQLKNLQFIHHNWSIDSRNGNLTYRHFPHEITQNLSGYGYLRQRRGMGGADMMMGEMMMGGDAAPAPMAAMLSADEGFADRSQQEAKKLSDKSGLAKSEGRVDNNGGAVEPQVDLENVSARKNLNETAFFFPHLVSGSDGTVQIEFTMPEALTEWKFLGFSHDQELRGGLLTGTTVTAKDLMVQPNPPRFLREGDVVEFTVKVSNQSPARQTGSVRLTFADARTGDSVDAKLQNSDRDQTFAIAAGESKSLSWRISVPDDLGFLTYKAVGSTGRLSDGEEGFLPVLSRRILVTESLPLPIRGKQTKEFEFTRLIESANSDTLKNKSLTVQMVSNPSWYAVMALPYLMEYPYECTEQTFNRLYANSLARHIAGSDPKIHRVFEQWRNTPALDSPMEKNQDLKAVMLEETPWHAAAQQESQARRNVGILFDDNRLDAETKRLLQKLTEMQYPDGAWPWFPGGRENDYITLYITTGFGRLRHLGADIDPAPAIKSLNRLDAWVTEQYNRIKPADRNGNHLSTNIAFYLYGRSFFLKDQPVAAEHREAIDYWHDQARKFWLQLGHRQSQAHLAIALKRSGDLKSAQKIMASIKERSVTTEEMGMFWRELEHSWWWYRAPIETQAMMIEA